MSKSAASWQEVEKEVVLVKRLIQRLPEEDRVGAAMRLVSEAALWAGSSLPEMLGILELAKLELMETDREVSEEEAGEKEE